MSTRELAISHLLAKAKVVSLETARRFKRDAMRASARVETSEKAYSIEWAESHRRYWVSVCETPEHTGLIIPPHLIWHFSDKDGAHVIASLREAFPHKNIGLVGVGMVVVTTPQSTFQEVRGQFNTIVTAVNLTVEDSEFQDRLELAQRNFRTGRKAIIAFLQGYELLRNAVAAIVDQ